MRRPENPNWLDRRLEKVFKEGYWDAPPCYHPLRGRLIASSSALFGTALATGVTSYMDLRPLSAVFLVGGLFLSLITLVEDRQLD